MGNRRKEAVNGAPASAGRRELVDFVSRDLDTTKADADLIVESVTRGIAELALRSSSVRVPNLGDFRVRETAERTGRNPRTGETVPVSSGRRLFFRATRSLKSSLNGRGGTR